jgi:hypothetical protein
VQWQEEAQPQQEPYSIEATARRCGDNRSSQLPSIPTYRSIQPTHLCRVLQPFIYIQATMLDLQLVPASSIEQLARVNRLDSNKLWDCRPQEWHSHLHQLTTTTNRKSGTTGNINRVIQMDRPTSSKTGRHRHSQQEWILPMVVGTSKSRQQELTERPNLGSPHTTATAAAKSA